MQSLLGADFERYLLSLENAPKRGLRLNTALISAENFKELFKCPIKSVLNREDLYEILSDEKLGNTPFHHAGMIYIQEPSSMLAALALDAKEGDRVLDLCAAPGGKTGQILAANKSGVVVANEIVKSRANILFSNIERQGYKNAVITNLDAESLAGALPNYFDKILVDAPCSGEGMFRKDEATIDEWNENLPKFNKARSLEILKNADKMLKQGGTLVYSTCTFNREEDEEVVATFARDAGYEILPLEKCIQDVTVAGVDEGGMKTSLTRKCFPFSDFGEGQFIAKLIKKSENENFTCKKQHKNEQKITKQELNLIKSFLKENIGRDNFYFYKLGSKIFLSEIEMPALETSVIAKGVCLGEIRKDRIEPHHQFFKAYFAEMKNKLNLQMGDPRIASYLHGEEIECENLKNGYATILFEGAPLGGGKVGGGGRIKNHYPRGLRQN